MSRAFNDASSQYLQSTGSPITSAPFTMAYWGYSDDADAAQTGLSIGDIDITNKYVRLYFKGNEVGDPIQLSVNITGSGTLDFPTTTGYSTNTWHHACGVCAAVNDWSVYIDGGSKGTDSTSVTLSDIDTVAVAAIARSTLGNYFSGNIAEAALWTAALSDAEVAVLAAGYSPLFVRPANLVFYAPLIGRTSPEIDIVGGYNMTLNAGPTTAAHPRIIYPGIQSITPPAPVGASINISPGQSYIQIS